MKILCVSDTTRSLAFSSVLTDVYGEADFVISAGDISVTQYDYLSTMLHRDLYYVYGNHNLQGYVKAMKKDPYAEYRKPFRKNYEEPFYGFFLDGKCIRDERTGLLLVGLGGSMRYNEGESQYTERQMRWRIWKLFPRLLYNRLRYGRYLDILVTHAPPKGIGDNVDICHSGFNCFLDFMHRFKPKFLLHGHIHLDDLNLPRVSHYEETTVINVYGSYMLDTEELERSDD